METHRNSVRLGRSETGSHTVFTGRESAIKWYDKLNHVRNTDM